MNDFTKEELTKIIIWGDLYLSGSGMSWPKMGSKKSNEILMKKIQSMIDNYCDHEADYVHPWPITCEKCGEKLE